MMENEHRTKVMSALFSAADSICGAMCPNMDPDASDLCINKGGVHLQRTAKHTGLGEDDVEVTYSLQWDTSTTSQMSLVWSSKGDIEVWHPWAKGQMPTFADVDEAVNALEDMAEHIQRGWGAHVDELADRLYVISNNMHRHTL